MDNAVILVRQLITMLLYMAAGWCMQKAKLITKANVSALTNFLLYVILPCVIINSFLHESTAQKTQALLQSLLISALSLAIAMALSSLCFHKQPQANFGSAFSNAGFMGIPLISAVLGSEAVFYVAGMVALLNVLQWTYGQAILQGSWDNCHPKEIAKNPLVLSFAVGLLLYFLPVTLPGQVHAAVRAVSACNAPVAMLILGVLLGDVSLKQLLCTKPAWLVSGMRLLVIPAATVAALMAFGGIPEEIRMAVLIAAAAPVGSNLAVYVQKQGQNSKDAVSMVCLSTLLSAITMPLVMMLSAAIWK